MDPKDTGSETEHGIHMVHDRVQQRALVNMVMNFRVL
jgi:hypothetical protein